MAKLLVADKEMIRNQFAQKVENKCDSVENIRAFLLSLDK